MFSRGGVSTDILTSNAFVDSAKALVDTTGPSGISLLADSSECPVYDGSAGCTKGSDKTPIHGTGYTYVAACGKQYTPSRSNSQVKVSTLTVNTYAQCFDACDVSQPQPLTYMSLLESAIERS